MMAIFSSYVLLVCAFWLVKSPPRKSYDEDGKEVLIFDQFEEILTLDPLEQVEREVFFMQVGDALRDPRRWALFSMREEYVASLDPYLHFLPTALNHTFRLDLLTAEVAKTVIQQTGQEKDVTFTDEATTKLVDMLRMVQVQQPDDSPDQKLGPYVEPLLLQVVCRRLWERLHPEAGRKLTVADIQQQKDVEQDALIVYYDETVCAVAERTKTSEQHIRNWFGRKLITSQGFRGQVIRGEHEQLEPSLRLFIDAHLIREDRRRGATWYELAHDRLIPAIRESNTRNLHWVQQNAELWREKENDERLLLDESELSEAQRWLDEQSSNTNDFSVDYIEIERSYVQKSATKADRRKKEAEEAQRKKEAEEAQRQRERTWLYALGVLVVVLAIVAGFAFWQVVRATKAENEANEAQAKLEEEKQNFEQQQRAASAQALALTAWKKLPEDPELSLLLSLEAESLDQHAQVGDVLVQAIRETHVITTLMEAHREQVRSVAFSPDGTQLVSAGWDDGERGIARLWDVATGKDLTSFAGHADVLYNAAFSPSGERMVTTSWDQTARVWDVPTATQQLTLSGHISGVLSADFSPDGQYIITIDKYTARLWDAESGAERARLYGHSDWVRDASFSPDGQYIVTASEDRTARIWHTPSLTTTGIISRSCSSTRDICQPQNPGSVPVSCSEPCRDVLLSQDGRVISDSIMLNDTEHLTETLLLIEHSGIVEQAVWSPDGTSIATASHDSTAKIWPVNKFNPTALITETAVFPHDQPVRDVAFSPDGKLLVTASKDNKAYVWNIEAKTIVSELRGHTDEVISVAWNDAGDRIASGSADGSIRLWDVAPLAQMLVLAVHAENTVNQAIYSPDGATIATAGQDGTIRLWDAESGEQQVMLEAPMPPEADQQITDRLAFSPDGQLLVSASTVITRAVQAKQQEESTIIRVWEFVQDDGSSLALRHTISVDQGQITDIVFSRDGTFFVTVSLDDSVRAWDTSSGQVKWEQPAGQRDLYRVSFSANDSIIVTAGLSNTLRFWDASSGKAREEYTLQLEDADTQQGSRAAYSPVDADVLATASGNRAQLWRWQDGEQNGAGEWERQHTLTGHEETILSLAFSPKGEWLVTSSADTTVRIWDVATGKLHLSISGHESGVTNAAFGPEGDRIIITEGQFTRTYPVLFEDIVAPAAQRKHRDLTAEERERYLLEMSGGEE